MLVPQKGNTGKSKLDNEGHNPILINDEESNESKLSRGNISENGSSNKITVPKSARPDQSGALQREQFKDIYSQILTARDNRIENQNSGDRNDQLLKKVKQKNMDQYIDFPVFFKYFRMNEIQMSITYHHEKNSFLNSKDLTVKLTPFISHYKFVPFRKMYD